MRLLLGVLLLTLLTAISAQYTLSSNCTIIKSCSSCIDSEYNCQWCDSCKDVAAPCDSAALETCDETYYTIIFICVISGMLLLCCCACYVRRRATQRGETIAELLAPLLPATARSFLFRNSMLNEGELEWMCIICGFDNKPRSSHCTMCGTERSLTQDYKAKKLEKHRLRNEKKLAYSKDPNKREPIDILIPEEAQITRDRKSVV